jgi:hypothetical protein
MACADSICSTSFGRGASLSWRRLPGAVLSVELRVPPEIGGATAAAPGWIALGVTSPNVEAGGNSMTGPPASHAVLGRAGGGGGGGGGGAAPVAVLALEKMSSPPGTLTPWRGAPGSASIVMLQEDGHRVLNFTASAIGPYKLLPEEEEEEEETTITDRRRALAGHVAATIPGRRVRMLWAAGTTGKDDLPTYHSLNRVVFDIDFRVPGGGRDTGTGLTPDGTIDPRTLRGVHGAAMALIWGLLTLVGAGFARYMRHKWYWYVVHKSFQSIASLMTLPLTYLAYYSKPEKNYDTVHGKLGLFLGTASTIQGLLGTLSVRSHKHFCGMSNPAWFDHGLRATHRTLGVILLVVASVQIGLGLEAFAPPILGEGSVLPGAGSTYIAWTSLVWCTVLFLELATVKGPYDYCKCRRKQNLPYNPVKGTGFMTKDDLITDRSAYFALRVLVERAARTVSEVLSRNAKVTGKCGACGKASKSSCKMDTPCLIYTWWNREPGRCVRRLSTFGLPSSIKFVRGHKSMSTKQLFQFAHWVIDLGREQNSSGEGSASEKDASRTEFQKLDSGLDHIFALLRVDRSDKSIKATDVLPVDDAAFLKERSVQLEGLSRKRVTEWGMEALADQEERGRAEEKGEKEEAEVEGDGEGEENGEEEAEEGYEI